MTKYFIKRILLAVIALAIIMTMVYFLVSLSPNKPISEVSPAYQNAGGHELYLADLHRMGLDQPVHVRFGHYIANMFHGDFGIIYGQKGNESIPDLFFGPLKYTLMITIPVFLLSSLIGISLGFLSGYNAGTWVDAMVNIFVIFFTAVPTFILAAVALIIGPSIGLPVSFVMAANGGVRGMILSLLIPILIMTVTSLAAFTYYTRNEVVTILQTNQVAIARSKGLDEWEVFKKHVFRNASIPLITIIIPSFIMLLAGSFVVEKFFQIPGSSTIIVSAVQSSEYNIIMFNTLFFTGLGLLTSIVVDMLFVVIDPRIRFSSATQFKFIQYLKARRKRTVTRQNAAVKSLNTNGGKDDK